MKTCGLSGCNEYAPGSYARKSSTRRFGPKQANREEPRVRAVLCGLVRSGAVRRGQSARREETCLLYARMALAFGTISVIRLMRRGAAGPSAVAGAVTATAPHLFQPHPRPSATSGSTVTHLHSPNATKNHPASVEKKPFRKIGESDTYE